MERRNDYPEPKTQFSDMLLECVDCQRTFVLKAREQDFYYNKGLSIPKRCPQCRLNRRKAVLQ